MYTSVSGQVWPIHGCNSFIHSSVNQAGQTSHLSTSRPRESALPCGDQPGLT